MTDIQASQGFTLAAAGVPAEGLNASQAMILTAQDGGPRLEVEQAFVLVAARGRTADPRVRAWSFSLDGHDFYVLRVGTIETLVYDISVGEWYVWGSGDADLWRAYTGFNWAGGRKVGQSAGTTVVVGDDGNGALYFLDPLKDEDDDFIEAGVTHPFLREITGQVVVPFGYSAQPCFGVQLFGSIGQQDVELTNATVTLETSDDRGASYIDHGSITLTQDELSARLAWRSLGSMEAPGRLFRITDYGALKRIDSLKMEGGDVPQAE